CAYATALPQPPSSFPTRRSSDLTMARVVCGMRRHTLSQARDRRQRAIGVVVRSVAAAERRAACRRSAVLPAAAAPACRRAGPPRSEEHTSELQSLTNLVCRLLLE